MAAGRTLLLVTAHPDDESFGPGGTVARYADAGVRVVLVCATLGEAGKAGDPPVCTPEELPEVRRRELEAAARVLGIAEIELLGYRDRELERVDPREAVARLLDAFDRHRPDVVLTFPPGGISGHPDHRAVSAWTEEAVRRWRRDGAGAPRLYYFTAPAYFRLTGTPPRDPRDAAFTARIDVAAWLPRKLAAIRCHRSQHLSAERILGALAGDRGREAWTWEYYLHAVPPPPPGAPPAEDLFDPPLA